MSEIKVSEMIEAESVNDEDLIMIVQNGVNKKVPASKVGTGQAGGDTLPIGAIMPFGSDTIPENWLLCNGQEVSRTDYAELFKILGTAYGEGNGSTTFNLPNYKGRVAAGKDENDIDFNTLGNTGGEKEHTLTVDEMHEHNHMVHLTSTEVSNGTGKWIAQYAEEGNINTYSTGGSQPHNNLQPYIITNYIIKAKQSAGLVATVVDNLESESEIDALSAKKGRVLDEKFSKHIITAYLSQQLFGLSKKHEVIPLDTSKKVGNKLSLENNAIKIAEGVSKVIISGAIFYQDYGTETSYLFPAISINGIYIAKEIVSRCENTIRYQSVTFPPFIMEVKDGDLIRLSSGDNSEGSIRGCDMGVWCTYMTVEVVE